MKFRLITVLLLLAIMPVFAIDGLSFSAVSSAPLYNEAKADPYAFTSHLYVTHMESEEDSAFFIRALVKDSAGKIFYKDFPTSEDLSEMTKRHNNLSLKPSTRTALARITYQGSDKFPKIEAETSVNAYINALFILGGGSDCLGFDGSYFLGETIKVADNYTLRFGLHHFSGHYGDERLDDFYLANNFRTDESSQTRTISYDGETYSLLGLASYVRDNDFQVSYSMNLFDSLRVYSSLDVPMHKSWFRPFVNCPANHETGATHGEDGFTDLAESDGVDLDADKDQVAAEKALRGPEYKALRFVFGMEYEKQFSFGTLYAGFNIQAHQDGKTKHQIGQYSKENKWDYEFTAGGGFEFSDSFAGNSKIGIEAYYHYGRPSVTQYYYKNSFESISVGLRVI